MPGSAPNGHWVVTAGPITAGLRSVSDGRLVYLLQGHDAMVLAVALLAPGDRIATGGLDGTVRLWSCPVCGGVGQLLALADKRLAATGRQPTDAERQTHGL